MINQKIHHLNWCLVNDTAVISATIYFCTVHGPSTLHFVLKQCVYVRNGINYTEMCHYAWYILWFVIHQLNLHVATRRARRARRCMWLFYARSQRRYWFMVMIMIMGSSARVLMRNVCARTQKVNKSRCDGCYAVEPVARSLVLHLMVAALIHCFQSNNN